MGAFLCIKCFGSFLVLSSFADVFLESFYQSQETLALFQQGSPDCCPSPVLKVKGISIIQWFCLDLLTVGIPIENSISEDFFRFAITQNLTVRS